MYQRVPHSPYVGLDFQELSKRLLEGRIPSPGNAGTHEELRRKSDDGEIQSVKYQGHFGKIFADEH
jgi:hypothetical protein